MESSYIPRKSLQTLESKMISVCLPVREIAELRFIYLKNVPKSTFQTDGPSMFSLMNYCPLDKVHCDVSRLFEGSPGELLIKNFSPNFLQNISQNFSPNFSQNVSPNFSPKFSPNFPPKSRVGTI